MVGGARMRFACLLAHPLPALAVGYVGAPITHETRAHTRLFGGENGENVNHREKFDQQKWLLPNTRSPFNVA